MGMLDWLFKKNHFKRAEDAFALNREVLWDGLKNSIAHPTGQERDIWLIVHFMDRFTEVQERLELWGLDYEIVSSKLVANELERIRPNGTTSPAGLKLILADLIPKQVDLVALPSRDADGEVAMIALERHPQVNHDDRVESFARSLPWRVEFGYFMALEDAVVKISIDDQVIEILQQLGLNNELISSKMVARRLETVLRRLSSGFTGDTSCNSAEEWLEVNTP